MRYPHIFEEVTFRRKSNRSGSFKADIVMLNPPSFRPEVAKSSILDFPAMCKILFAVI